MTTLKSWNPSTGELVGEVPTTVPSSLPAVVARARVAQPGWDALGLQARGALLSRACAVFVERAKELGTLLTREMGKPLQEGIGEVKECGARIEQEVASIVAALREQIVEDGRTKTVMYRDAYGVCAAITPWNFPISMPHWMCLPALLAGNTVVLKPSEETPLIAQAYVDVLNETLPTDVLQIVHGSADVGKALVASDVDLVAFTGSMDVGKKILAACAPGLKRVILELGGKDPMIVLEGADIPRVGRIAAGNSFRNAGQVCVSTERIYVPRSISDEFVKALCAAAETMTVGDGMEPGTKIGPMINSRQRDHVLGQIDEAIGKGAVLVFGGVGHRDGFVMPTVLRNVTHDMNIARDETFGPVACIIEVADVEEAIRLANDSDFGLGATVFGPQEEAMKVGRRLRAGMVGVNKSCGGAENTPWVGAQKSGYGFHSGTEGHRQFTQIRLVSTKS